MKLLIGLPVYNGALSLSRAIESLLTQDVDDLVLVISDNGSSDSTPEICQSAATRDPRVRSLREETNRGPTWNFNRVLSFAREATFFMWAAHDDVWAPDYASSCIRFLEEHPDVALCGTRVRMADDAGAETGEVDVGCSTLGLSPVDRAVEYARTVDLNSVFYGVYRSAVLEGRTLENRVANDHAFLLDLSLRHPIHVLEEVKLTRRIGGTSRNIRSIARTLGVSLKYPWPLTRFEVMSAPREVASSAPGLSPRERRRIRRAIFWGAVTRYLRRRFR